MYYKGRKFSYLVRMVFLWMVQKSHLKGRVITEAEAFKAVRHECIGLASWAVVE